MGGSEEGTMTDTRDIQYDDILEELGEMGRYQIFIYILVCLPVLFSGANSLSYVFTVGVPKYRCLVPECEDLSNTSYNEPWTDWALPKEEEANKVIGVIKYNCDRYVPKNSSDIDKTCSKELFSNTLEHCSQWVFDDSEKTVVSEFQLTCSENQWRISLVGSSHFAGIIIGSFVFGLLADKFGRKPIFIICILIMSISGSFQALSPNYTTFVFLIFVNSLGTAGVYPLAFILGVEMVGKKKRELTGIVLNYFYAVGEAIVSPIAWYTRDWKPTQLSVSLPPIIFIVYYWGIPESVRWLLAQKKKSKAEKIVYKAARINKVFLSTPIKESFKEKTNLMSKEDVGIFPVVKDMLRSTKLIIRFAIIYFIWGVNAFVFYGLSINSTSLGGNKYINFALVSLVEIPGYTIAWLSIEKIGRRISLSASLLVCGISCFLTIITSHYSVDWLVIVMFLVGKLGVTSAFGVVYVHTAELLPTIIRSGGVGSASTIARVGALLAPFVPLLDSYYVYLPMILFGVVGVIAGLLALLLPETLGYKLPETVEEAKRI